VAHFLHEIGHLRRVGRSGWDLAGLARESVAEHSFRTAAIAAILATTAGASPSRCALLAVAHDLPETRLGDHHHLAQRYVEGRERATERAGEAQRARLPAPMGELFDSNAYSDRERSIVADADTLDALLFIREEMDVTSELAQRWCDYLIQRLRTEPARRLADEIVLTSPSDWWLEALGEQ